jgi:hypothetical protein
MSKHKAVVVRAYSGVFFGYLVERKGGPECCEVILERARHIHRWQSVGLPRKALNVEDLAILGAGEGTTIGGPVTQTILDVKVIVDASPEAAARFEALPCRA